MDQLGERIEQAAASRSAEVAAVVRGLRGWWGQAKVLGFFGKELLLYFLSVVHPLSRGVNKTSMPHHRSESCKQ